MGSWRVALLVLVLLVIGILHLPPAEAHGWTTKSSEPNAPIWRRSLAVEHNVSTTGAAYGQNQRSDRQTKPNGGDLPFGFGVDFGSSFSLSRSIEALKVTEIESLISFSTITSLSIPSEVDATSLLSIIHRVLSESPLEEVEILQPMQSLDFSRQHSVKRLAIDHSLLNALSSYSWNSLEYLAINNIQGAIESPSESNIGESLSFGPHELLIEATSFSPPNTYEERARRSSNEPNASFPSLVHRASAVLASFTPSDSETNDTVANYFCSYDNSSVTSITMVPTGSKWFNFPSCISYWTGLSNVFCTNCRVLNFGNLPSSVRSLLLQSVIGGTWSQADAGTSSGPDADYFDWSWLSNLPLLTSMSMSYSSLNGTLPNHLNHSLLQSLSLQLTGTGNPLIGTISPSWFLQYPDMTSMVLSNNKISGTFPNYALQKLTGVQFDNNEISHFPPLIINATSSAPTLLTTMSFSNNKLVQIPSESDFQAMTALSYIYLHSNPDLSGTFPNLWNRSGSTLLLDIQANNCSFSGALPEMPESLIATYAAATIQQLSFNSNRFTGTIPASWSSLNFRYLFLQDNPGLGGALATIDDDGNILSQFVHSVVFLAISGSGFTGPMFNISTLTALQTLTVQTPNVDFCIQTRLNNASQPSAFPSSLGNCDLSTTNASVCDSMYPPICVTTEWIPPMTPVSSPVTPPTASTNCPLPSPGDKFLCKDGIWVSSGSVTEQTITIAPSSTVIVNGNLTTSSVVIASTSSTINVTGCISTESGSAPAVTVTLTQSDLEKIIKNGGSLTSTLIQQSSGCNLSLATSSLSVDTSSIKSCKTVKTDKIGTSSGLTATFTVVSTSKCNTWWIILVSVVCGAVLIALVAILVVCNVLKKNRHRKERAGLSG